MADDAVHGGVDVGGATIEPGRRAVTLEEAVAGCGAEGARVSALVLSLRALVAVPSVNPEHECSNPANVGEGRVAETLRAAFAEAGADEAWTDESDTAPERPNVYAVFLSAESDASGWIGVDDHIDTVTVENMPDSHAARFSGYLTVDAAASTPEARLETLRIHGRGTCDTKATFAVLLHRLREMRAAGERPARNLIVCGTVGEETGRVGACAFDRELRKRGILVDQLLVAEPTSLAPVHAHKGTCRLNFDVAGLAGHSSIPHKLRNAAVGASAVVLALHGENERLAALPDADFEGIGGLRPTVAPTVVHADAGGINVVPGAARVQCCRRVVPGEDLDAVQAELTAVAQKAVDALGLGLTVDVSVHSRDPAFWQDPACGLVGDLAGFAGTKAVVAPYGTNATGYTRGVTFNEACVFGPGSIAQAHMRDEWCPVVELVKMDDVVAKWLAKRA